MTTAIEYFNAAIAEDRIMQGAWNKTIAGKKYVCLAAAWGEPGTIKSVKDCPAHLFPRWVFELMPTLDDGVAASDVRWLFHGFANRAERMASFTPEQWDTVRTAFLIGVIDVAVDAARTVQPSPAPAYWQQVVDACEQVKSALKANDKTAWAAAAAAKA
jgi:hypothetical protein